MDRLKPGRLLGWPFQFAQDFSSFSTKIQASQEPFQTQINWDGWLLYPAVTRLYNNAFFSFLVGPGFCGQAYISPRPM